MAEFVAKLRALNVTPVAQNTTNRRSAIDARTTRHPGYTVSGRVCKRIEEMFGWAKAIAGFRKTPHRRLARVGWVFTLETARLIASDKSRAQRYAAAMAKSSARSNAS